MSKSWFESLPKDLQDIVMETSLEVQQSHKQLMADANGGYLANIEASGTKVTYLTDEEKAAFKAASTPVYDEFKDIIGADILDRTQAFIEDNK
jgi:C4-dicarboxylate-binding protein DctP